MRIKDWLALAGFVALSEGAGIVGTLFTTPSIATWYSTLARPELAPPNWVFGPVWTTLYVLMGIAAFLVWRHDMRRHDVKIALTLFVLQLALNTLWSIIFFGFHNPGAALIEIALLWLSIAAMIWKFSKVSVPAAWILAPYLAWVSFAAYLNYMIFALNF